MRKLFITAWQHARTYAGVALVFFAATRLNIALAEIDGSVSAVNLLSGIGFAVLILGGPRLWPGIVLGVFLANLSVATGVLMALLIAVGSAAGSLIGVVLAKKVFDFRPGLARARDVITLFLPIALIASAFPATFGIATVHLDDALDHAALVSAWAASWLANAVGVAVVAPLVLTWHRGAIVSGANAARHEAWTKDALLLLPCVIAALTFLMPPSRAGIAELLIISIFPICVWCAQEARIRAIASANAVIAAVVVAGMATGIGPFGGSMESVDGMLQQGYIFAVSLVMLVLGAGEVQQRTTETALRESEWRFRTLWETATDVVLLIDNGKIIRFASPTVRGLLGHDPEALIGLPISIVEATSTDGGSASSLQAFLREGHRVAEFTARHRDGNVFPAEMVFSEFPMNGQRGQACFMRDISDRKAAERELRRSQVLFSTVFAASPLPIVFSGLANGRFLEANTACYRVFGYTREQVIGKTTLELGVWPDPGERELLIQRLRDEGRADQMPLTLRRGNGEHIDVLYSGQVTEFQGEPCIVGTLVDITARKRAEQEKRLSDERFAKVFNSSPDAITISRLDDGTYLEVNDAWERLCGYSREELIGKSSADLEIWVDCEQRAQLVRLLGHGRVVRDFEFPFRKKSGEIAESLMTAEVIELHGVTCLLAILIDVTERSQTLRQLRESEKRFADVLEAAGEYVWEIDADSRFTFVSERVRRVLGFAPAEMLGRRPTEFMPPQEMARVRELLRADRRDGDPFNIEHIILTRDGGQIWVRISGVPRFDAAGRYMGHRGTGLDITERKQAEQRIEELATRDALTQLPNRRLLNDRLSQCILAAQRTGGRVAVLFIDLDRFKTINDSLGHAAGDELLSAVAGRLQELMRKGDTLARIGGDEFVVVLEALRAAEDAGAVAQKIIATISEPFTIAGNSLITSASVGISVFPGDAPDGSTLVRNADMAMYFAKEHGRRNYQFYSEEMNARAVEKLTMESTLRQAIELEQFELYYHPKFSLTDGNLMGVEALVRWKHPELGMVTPASFIPICEDTGLIVPLGEWVLRRACAQGKAWAKTYGRIVPIAVNLSVGQFNKGLARTVHDALTESGLPPPALELEITESMLMMNVDENIDVLRRLSDLDVTIAIDDFGTGYSSLAYLRRFHVDTLKIDQSFVRDIDSSLDDTAIVEAIIALGHTLNLNVVAEGVETAEQRERLAALGCDQCQGYLFGRPASAAEFEARYLGLAAAVMRAG